MRGPTAAAAGDVADNLVLKAAHALAERAEGLKLGRFVLTKRPVAAGLGGGSADAAAALRLLARGNRIALDDPRLMAAARATGADVPVCLDPRPRLMRGIGDILSEPLDLPRLPAVLVNPGVAVPTKDVFAALRVKPQARPTRIAVSLPPKGEPTCWRVGERPQRSRSAGHRTSPVIADVLAALRACRLPARAHVGLGRDLLRPVRLDARGADGGARVADAARELVGARDDAGLGRCNAVECGLLKVRLPPDGDRTAHMVAGPRRAARGE